eukprot:CAMPEP_0175472552 /NCGR_PEP_ID=MMETSP0095-20121207/73927_1 /TAXON_ID=311494 /ORGANISM="Alexandrium monilatum, Strain CCMP3105" /LENGTH=164 /DNA_ID=CAMNT_0016774025 /DNA_START=52 /DNA_END=544 /DNA_ORIENTATION=+
MVETTVQIHSLDDSSRGEDWLRASSHDTSSGANKPASPPGWPVDLVDHEATACGALNTSVPGSSSGSSLRLRHPLADDHRLVIWAGLSRMVLHAGLRVILMRVHKAGHKAGTPACSESTKVLFVQAALGNGTEHQAFGRRRGHGDRRLILTAYGTLDNRLAIRL